ncbi:TPA: hypothetical protein ACPJZ3_001372 [Vibrio diabolicus]|nr:hypothetical protein [Vibrio alginolyticus]MCS0214893.1 hypothetical protein [Vibrio alginolyticus]
MRFSETVLVAIHGALAIYMLAKFGIEFTVMNFLAGVIVARLKSLKLVR